MGLWDRDAVKLRGREAIGPLDYGAMGPWAIALGGKRAFFDLLPHSGKPVTAREALYGRKRDNGASLRLVKRSLNPELRLRLHFETRFWAQHGF